MTLPYFPILRGKQFELIAIREFLEQPAEPGTLHPIIEPVRDPRKNNGLARAVQALEGVGMPYTVIVNPRAGELARHQETPDLLIEQLGHFGATPTLARVGILLHGQVPIAPIVSALDRSKLASSPCTLIYDSPPAVADDVAELSGRAIEFHVAKDKRSVRRLRWNGNQRIVQLDQPFSRRSTNIEYVGAPPTFLSDAHRYAAEDGYQGVADYLTVGDAYSETGGLPVALVIHLSYLDREEEAIYVGHFHSTTNFDTSDPAGKFIEALDSLIDFIDARNLDNPALDAFRAYHEQQKYPGLGVIKKLSMLNHMYVMCEALSS